MNWVSNNSFSDELDVKQQLFTPASKDTFGVFFPCGIASDKTYSWQALEEQRGSIWEWPLCAAAAAGLPHTALTKGSTSHP